MASTEKRDADRNQATPKFYRLNQIVQPNGVLPFRRSKLYELMRAGKVPRPRKVGSLSCWSAADIQKIADDIEAGRLAA